MIDVADPRTIKVLFETGHRTDRAAIPVSPTEQPDLDANEKSLSMEPNGTTSRNLQKPSILSSPAVGSLDDGQNDIVESPIEEDFEPSRIQFGNLPRPPAKQGPGDGISFPRIV